MGCHWGFQDRHTDYWASPASLILLVTKKLIFHSQYDLKVILHLSLSEFVWIWLDLS